jgi:hypothetical protein
MRLLALTTTHSASELEPADLIVPDLSYVSLHLSNGSGSRIELRSRA